MAINKVAAYLNEHMAGGVQVSAYVRSGYKFDTGISEATPTMVAYPASTNDIRKLARFAWQMAEKGHKMAITARGLGTDYTGAAISKGLIIDTRRYMNAAFEIDVKQKQIRVQPGIDMRSLNSTLALHGLELSGVWQGGKYGTIGGAIANASYNDNAFSWKEGVLGAVHQLEVILPTGEVLQTGRISKRELESKKGLQTFEGEIYRTLDRLVEDYADVIDDINASDSTAGYPGIAMIKDRSGGMDLTPIFVGSQGTLGIISEVILKADFRAAHRSVAVVVCDSIDEVVDISNEADKIGAKQTRFIDGITVEQAGRFGKTVEWLGGVDSSKSVLIIEFAEFSERAVAKSLKRLAKKCGDKIVRQSGNDISREELLALMDISQYVSTPQTGHAFGNASLRGIHVPRDRFSDFKKSVLKISEALNLTISISGDMQGEIVHLEPVLDLSKVGDRQKITKLIDALANYVYSVEGVFIGQGSDGRTKSGIYRSKASAKELELVDEIRNLFDPYGFLNPGVKQAVEKTVADKFIRHSSIPMDFAN